MLPLRLGQPSFRSVRVGGERYEEGIAGVKDSRLARVEQYPARDAAVEDFRAEGCHGGGCGGGEKSCRIGIKSANTRACSVSGS